ncbi:MAG: tellurite resistance TerB family protein, partial [Pseudomonadota bacterium]
ADYNADGLVDASQACGELLSSESGLEIVLELIRSSLPVQLRETAYAIALEVAAADLDVRPEETRFLELLADSLEIDMLTKSAIERGIRARNKIL